MNYEPLHQMVGYISQIIPRTRSSPTSYQLFEVHPLSEVLSNHDEKL